MSLPYASATSGQNAIKDIEKILKGFGCSRFGNMMDYERGELLVQFEYRGRQVTVKASIHGYTAAWLKEYPCGRKTSRTAHEQKARAVASVAVYSIVRDWIKGQITAVETGMLTFDGAFLGHLLLPTGKTVFEAVTEQKLLPAPEEKVVQIGKIGAP
jgi:hypothetical protein